MELPIFSDEIFGQYEWQSWNIRDLRKDNDFADVTLACEDGQLVEAHKVIFAGQDRYHYINTSNINIDDININEFKSITPHHPKVSVRREKI